MNQTSNSNFFSIIQSNNCNQCNQYLLNQKYNINMKNYWKKRYREQIIAGFCKKSLETYYNKKEEYNNFVNSNLKEIILHLALVHRLCLE